MPKTNTSIPPPLRSSVVTRSHMQGSTSTVQPIENQMTIPTTHVLEEVNRRHLYHQP